MESIVDVKASVLGAGSKLLKEHGIAALTQPRVARAAGVKQSHLTYYFPKRSDLLLGIAAHVIDETMSALSSRLETAPPQAAFAETIGAMMIEGIPPRIMIGLIVAADEEPTLRVPLRELIGGVRKRIEEMLDRVGMAQTGKAARILHATVVGLAIMHHAQHTAASATDVREGLADVIDLLLVEQSPLPTGDKR